MLSEFFDFYLQCQSEREIPEEFSSLPEITNHASDSSSVLLGDLLPEDSSDNEDYIPANSSYVSMDSGDTSWDTRSMILDIPDSTPIVTVAPHITLMARNHGLWACRYLGPVADRVLTLQHWVSVIDSYFF